MVRKVRVGNGLTVELNDQQRQFADYYVVSGNGGKSAIRAGYSPATAESQANRLLSNEKVAEYIRFKQSQLAEKHGIELQDIVIQLINMGFTTIDKVINMEKGVITVKDLSEIPTEALPAIDSISQSVIKGQLVTKIKLVDRTKPLDMLLRIHGWYKDGDLGGKGNTGASKLMAELQEQYRAKLQQGKNVRKVQ